MTWTDYFDAIYLINLPDRPDRLEKATQELNKYNIPFVLAPAIKRENGAQGLFETIISIFTEAEAENMGNILLLEDDVKFLQDPNVYMPKCVEQLSRMSWDLFYLGINMDHPSNMFIGFTFENLLKIRYGYSTHAIAWSRPARREFMSLYMSVPNFMSAPIDVRLSETIHKNGRSFASYPLLATQHDGMSSIEGENTSYEYIEQRFNHSISHLKIPSSSQADDHTLKKSIIQQVIKIAKERFPDQRFNTLEEMEQNGEFELISLAIDLYQENKNASLNNRINKLESVLKQVTEFLNHDHVIELIENTLNT